MVVRSKGPTERCDEDRETTNGSVFLTITLRGLRAYYRGRACTRVHLSELTYIRRTRNVIRNAEEARERRGGFSFVPNSVTFKRIFMFSPLPVHAHSLLSLIRFVRRFTATFTQTRKGKRAFCPLRNIISCRCIFCLRPPCHSENY